MFFGFCVRSSLEYPDLHNTDIISCLWYLISFFLKLDKRYNPAFDTKKKKKVLQALILLACKTFLNFSVARYASCFFVSAQIFFIFLMGTICFDVQKPKAS